MFSRSSALESVRYAGRYLFHTSTLLAARPKYSVRKGMKFVPARARLADTPQFHAPRRSSKGPNEGETGDHLESTQRSTYDSKGKGDVKKQKAPKRERIMDIPSDLSPSRDSSSPVLSFGFTSPPLLNGLVEQIRILLGPKAKPTPIQALSLSHFFRDDAITPSPRGTLLAAETGSGKSLAYLLPVVQSLKKFETVQFPEGYIDKALLSHDTLDPAPAQPNSASAESELVYSQSESSSDRPEPRYNPSESTNKPSTPIARPGQLSTTTDNPRIPAPKALILVPTHELARQIKSSLSQLTHADDTRLRSTSLSHRATISMNKVQKPSDLAFANTERPASEEDAISKTNARDVDVVVSTPSMVLDNTRPEGRHGVGPKRPGDEDFSRKRVTREPRMSLRQVKWVVVDEADVLFDPDFSSWTEAVLQDIQTGSSSPPNLILATATISSQLSTYLSKNYPALKYLTTPNLHRLPSSLHTEHVHWDRRPGNRFPTILRKMKDLWAQEEQDHPGWKEKSKVVVFCNRSTKVEELGAFLEDKGVHCVKLTSTSEARARGSNRHIQTFLKPPPHIKRLQPTENEALPSGKPSQDEPRVLITTSLLSRGLDFSPLVTSVFIVDEPRNEVDYIHRAGRTGRAGRPGKVVVFSKGQGGRERAASGTRKVWGFDAA